MGAMRECYWLSLLALALGIQSGILRAQERGPANEDRDRVVRGTVVAVNVGSDAITVRPSNLFGRLLINIRSYRVKQPMSLNGLHSGDRVIAVYSRSDGMLHRLRRLRNYQVFDDRHN